MNRSHRVEKAQEVLETLLSRRNLGGVLEIRNQRLVVWVRDPSWSQELNLLKPTILSNLAHHVPEARVRDIRFRTTSQAPKTEVSGKEGETVPYPSRQDLENTPLPPSAREKIHRAVQEIRHEELREMMQRIMEDEQKSRRWRLHHGWKICPQCQGLYYGEQRLCAVCYLEAAGIRE